MHKELLVSLFPIATYNVQGSVSIDVCIKETYYKYNFSSEFMLYFI